MKKKLFIALASVFLFASCDKEIRNLAEINSNNPTDPDNPTEEEFSTEVNPVNVNFQGFEFLEKMQGHWTGTNVVIADQYDWFAFDYRAISESHVHGIFEGGTMGNLFTSFFVTDFKNTRTIMARNGGVLSGIYRTTYFVLDSVSNSADGDFYRFVDANAGSRVMSMELLFRSDSLYFNAYTSRLGEFLPTRHMTFKGVNSNPTMAQAAATATGFPQNTPAWDFSNGFNEAWLAQSPSPDFQTATFLAESQTADVYTLAQMSGDPFTISDHPRIASIYMDIVRTPLIDNQTTFVYLSTEPLTDAQGYFTSSATAFNSITHFPEVIGTEDQFLFTYIHPGDYYVTVVADVNGDGAPGPGDVTHATYPLTLTPGQNAQITVDNITVQN